MVSKAFHKLHIRETTNLQRFKTYRILFAQKIEASGKAMSKTANDRKERFERESAAEVAWITLANDTNYAIRQRLQAVASDLRLAAASAGTAGENLLQLAIKFEHHARAGDLQ